jgi:hypothetical protein
MSMTMWKHLQASITITPNPRLLWREKNYHEHKKCGCQLMQKDCPHMQQKNPLM